jgi:hypothetical protein
MFYIIIRMETFVKMINIHTGGAWQGSALELSKHVRPVFVEFISQAMERDIRVAICTFSPQTRHIAEVLRILFPHNYQYIIVRGRDRSWSYEGNGMKNGKQPYMASAATELQVRYPSEEFSKTKTILIDDDRNNVLMALQDGTRAVWLNDEDDDFQILEDLQLMI